MKQPPTAKKIDGRSYRTYWKQQRRLENLKTERDLIVHAIGALKVFGATNWGSWLLAYSAVALLDTGLDPQHRLISSADIEAMKDILKSAAIVSAIGSAATGTVGALTAAFKGD